MWMSNDVSWYDTIWCDIRWCQMRVAPCVLQGILNHIFWQRPSLPKMPVLSVHFQWILIMFMHLHAGLLCSTLHVPYWVQVPRKSLMNGLLLFLTQLPTFQSTGWPWCIASSNLSPVSRFHSLEQNPAQYHERSAALDMSISFCEMSMEDSTACWWKKSSPGMYKPCIFVG